MYSDVLVILDHLRSARWSLSFWAMRVKLKALLGLSCLRRAALDDILALMRHAFASRFDSLRSCVCLLKIGLLVDNFSFILGAYIS